MNTKVRRNWSNYLY